MALEDALRSIVGDPHVLTDRELTAAYERDRTGRFGGRARLVVRPGDPAETAAVLAALASRAREHDLDAALDFAARDSATLGGVVACDAGGARALRYGTARARVAGLEGDGNLHINLLGPTASDATLDDAVLERALACGGTISAEHGIGVAKGGVARARPGAAEVAAMRAVKAALDPSGRLNPGVVLPVPGMVFGAPEPG